MNNGKAVGYIIYQIKVSSENPFKHGNKSLVVYQICIKNNLQRNGYDKLALRYLNDVAYKHHCDFIELDYWSENIEVGNFYEKLRYINVQNSMMKHL